MSDQWVPPPDRPAPPDPSQAYQPLDHPVPPVAPPSPAYEPPAPPAYEPPVAPAPPPTYPPPPPPTAPPTAPPGPPAQTYEPAPQAPPSMFQPPPAPPASPAPAPSYTERIFSAPVPPTAPYGSADYAAADPVTAAPVPPPWGVAPGMAPPVRSAPTARRGWNWAAGTVIGVAALSAVYAIPSLLLRIDAGNWGDITTGEGLLWGSLLVGLVALALLATDNPLPPGVASFVAASLGIAAILYDVKPWDLPRQAAYSPWMAVAAYLVLGLCALVGLRRRD